MAGAVRRIGGENSATRALILEVTEQLMRDEGYAAVSTRRVAAKAGLKPSLVHYYFPTTDDLFLAAHRRGAAQSEEMIDAALNSPDPVRALWNFFTDSSRTGLMMETLAVAMHRPALRAAIVAQSELMRQKQIAALTRAIGARLEETGRCAPAGLALVLAGIGRALVMEEGLGIDGGHSDARAFVDRWLDELLEDRSPAGK